jgi:hypothetical protein
MYRQHPALVSLLVLVITFPCAFPPGAGAGATAEPVKMSGSRTAPEWTLRVLPIDHLVQLAGRRPLLWPDFRPEVVPTLYNVRGHGMVYANPATPLPGEFAPVPGLVGGWTDESPFALLEGRQFAMSSILPNESVASNAGLAIHEMFHQHEARVRSEGRMFGGAEDPPGIRLYPAFDAVNMTLLGREGDLIARALATTSLATVRNLAREFLAVRATRRSRLSESVVVYEDMTELNEGLAEYVRLRALQRWASEAQAPWNTQAEQERRSLLARQDKLHRLSAPQLRRVFYVTGSGIGLLLDRLDPGWAVRLIRENRTLVGQLNHVVGGRADTRVSPSADPGVAEYLRSLEGRRVVEADSLLGGEGLVVEIVWQDGSGFHVCGLDPLNAKPVGDGRVLHRFLRLCHDDELVATIGESSVEGLDGHFIAVPLGIDSPDSFVTVDGVPLNEWIDAGSPPAKKLAVDHGGVHIESPVERVTYADSHLKAWLRAP